MENLEGIPIGHKIGKGLQVVDDERVYDNAFLGGRGLHKA